MDDARVVLQSLLLATATTLDSFRVCVSSATELYDHEVAMKNMAETAENLAQEMRQIASTL